MGTGWDRTRQDHFQINATGQDRILILSRITFFNGVGSIPLKVLKLRSALLLLHLLEGGVLRTESWVFYTEFSIKIVKRIKSPGKRANNITSTPYITLLETSILPPLVNRWSSNEQMLSPARGPSWQGTCWCRRHESSKGFGKLSVATPRSSYAPPLPPGCTRWRFRRDGTPVREK